MHIYTTIILLFDAPGYLVTELIGSCKHQNVHIKLIHMHVFTTVNKSYMYVGDLLHYVNTKCVHMQCSII